MFNYEGIKINYVDYGDKNKNSILFLHGWGQNIEMMKKIADPLKDNNRIIILDLPGFGESEEPKTAWSLDDYVKMIHSLLDKLNIQAVSLVGHSFGGKIALLYASTYKINKLVVLASPFKVREKKISWKVKFLKRLSKVPLLNKIAYNIKIKMGSADYQNASPMMRNILVKHVNYDITEKIKKIKCPTFIIWGENDTAVPVSDAYELERLIPDSGLSVYNNCTHYAYLENLPQTIAILKSFLE